jgi:tRNA (guanine37-N1)-methyltransferase
VRIDIISIFPEFFGVLDISLLGKARERGLIDLGVHDLRDFAHDRHRTVDDTPYGGGAGMVMKPEPWGEAFDAVLAGPGAGAESSVVVFPSPAGERFTQATARELALEPHLVFGATRASTSGSSSTRRPVRACACAKSASATTCSTGERSP